MRSNNTWTQINIPKRYYVLADKSSNKSFPLDPFNWTYFKAYISAYIHSHEGFYLLLAFFGDTTIKNLNRTKS